MLIKALCDYADKIAERGEDKIPDGWSEQPIHFRIMLTPEGDLDEIVDVREVKETIQKNGKIKTTFEPKKIILPFRTQKSAIDSNIIEHRPLYIFGLNLDGSSFTAEDSKNRAKKSHKAFMEFNLRFFDGLNSDICKAYRRFIEKWIPENEEDNPLLISLGKDYNGAYFGFGLTGGKGNLEEDQEFRTKYTRYFKAKEAEDSDTKTAVCGITGEVSPISRLHDKIKFPGGNTTGCVLVGMKDTAFSSYGKEQSYNSNISKYAMKKYTSTLNDLLADKAHRTLIGDMVIVYFAMKSDDSAECILSSMLMTDRSDSVEMDLDKLFEYSKSGAVNLMPNSGIDEDVTFYAVGMTPNSSRICQKFIYRDRFGSFIKNLVQHQNDLRINPDNKRQIFFSGIARELVSPKASRSSDSSKVPAPLMSSIMLAAFNGTNYPVALFENVIRRIKTNSDEENNRFIKLNDTRAGIIKACINRKLRIKGKKEEFKMSLDKNNLHPAYLCGRLFAVYEKIQKDSSGGGLNRTIKDSYFSSAASRPSAIMPKLSQLSHNHMRKLSEGSGVYYNKLISKIMDGLNGEFPQTLDLDSQGRFIIGYYQQNKELYKSTKNESEEN